MREKCRHRPMPHQAGLAIGSHDLTPPSDRHRDFIRPAPARGATSKDGGV
jgi:hypothetical protein